MANHAATPANYMRVPELAQGGTHNDNAQEEEKMWKTSLDQISEGDRWMIDAWIEDANGILAFTGLLSATIGAFIIEFYKTLSPDSGGQTVALLGQISQQLANTRNGTSITAANQPFSPSIHMVWVNAIWLISLVFSLTSALITSLNQQAVRRYIETPKVESKPSDRARVHLLLFRGIKLYKMPLATMAAPALLHLSILLFLGGLVIVFHTIHEEVAIALEAAVGVSALVYIAMSLLPLLDFKCPYRTPITFLLMHSWRAFLSFVAYCGHLFLFATRLPGCSYLCPCPCTCLVLLDSDSLDSAGSGKQHILPGLSNSLEKVVDEDPKTITWLFRQLSLGDKNKFLIFAASIPRHKVVELIPPIKSGKFVLRRALLVLLQSCTDDTGAVGPGEDVRKDALFVCLTAIHHIAKASSIPDLNFVRSKFANISLMRVLWNDRDDSIRIISRSICALVARQVIRKRRLEDADISWLEEVLGEPSNAILENNVTVRDQMNFKSFLYGALPSHGSHFSTEDAISFNETLAILLDVRTDDPYYFSTPDWQNRLDEEVAQIQQYDPEGGREVFNRLHSMFLSFSAVPAVDTARLIHSDARLGYPEAPSIQAPSIHVEAPTLQSEAPSSHAEASFPREGPSVHREGPFPSVVPSPPAPRPRPRPRRATHSSQVTRPALVTPSPRAVPPPQAVSPPHAASPPRIFSPPRAVPLPRIFLPPHAVPLPRAAPSPVVHTPLGRAIPPQAPRAVFPTYAAPPPRAAPSPSPSAVPSPSVPPSPRVASPSRTTRRSHTARPPHAPI
ncbi:hypothetical protein F5888DRAFT_1953307 [Russula emetica]|nr:hypothetical protein F5888DRAFT_1953307 [Russula emetica]